LLRPQHHYAISGFQCRFGGDKVVFAAFELAIPPHVETRSLKQRDDRTRPIKIDARIADENRRALPVPRLISVNPAHHCAAPVFPFPINTSKTCAAPNNQR